MVYNSCCLSPVTAVKLNIKVIPNASKNQVKEDSPGGLKVYLTAPPTDGKANEALIEVLAKHFGVAKQQVNIVRGHKSRQKVVAIG